MRRAAGLACERKRWRGRCLPNPGIHVYQPDNLVLIISGQIDPAKTLFYVAETCGAIPRPTRKLDETYTM